MLMLGISTSSKNPSVAVMEDGKILNCMVDKSGKSHSATLMTLMEKSLNAADASIKDVGCIAVDVGPGSFTGVRIGVSCANALAYSLGVGVIPVCSLAALRNRIPEKGTVCVLLDCRNGNCYAAAYENGREVMSPCPEKTDVILNSMPEGTAFIGDCGENAEYPDAGLVLLEAAKNIIPEGTEAVPMYLRPSQAERMRGEKKR